MRSTLLAPPRNKPSLPAFLTLKLLLIFCWTICRCIWIPRTPQLWVCTLNMGRAWLSSPGPLSTTSNLCSLRGTTLINQCMGQKNYYHFHSYFIPLRNIHFFYIVVMIFFIKSLSFFVFLLSLNIKIKIIIFYHEQVQNVRFICLKFNNFLWQFSSLIMNFKYITNNIFRWLAI